MTARVRTARCAGVAVTVALLGLSVACGNDPGTAATPARSAISISFTPDPPTPTSAPNSRFAISYTMTIRETAGLAATVNFWTETLENPTTNTLAPATTLGADELARFGLSTALPAGGALAVPRQYASYFSGVAGSSAINVKVLVQVTDARGNVINTTAQLRVP